jgi:hypothetical protein
MEQNRLRFYHNKIKSTTSAVWQNPQKNGYTWWWLIIAETCCVYVTSEQNKNNKFFARRTEVNCLIISEFFTCSRMLKYNIMRLQIIHILTSESVTVTYFLCYSIQLSFQQISREGCLTSKWSALQSAFVVLLMTNSENTLEPRQPAAASGGYADGYVRT